MKTSRLRGRLARLFAVCLSPSIPAFAAMGGKDCVALKELIEANFNACRE